MASSVAIKSLIAKFSPRVREIQGPIKQLSKFLRKSIMPQLLAKSCKSEKTKLNIAEANHNQYSTTQQPLITEDIAIPLLINGFEVAFNVSVVLTQALFDLATKPEYLEPLRDEIACHWSGHEAGGGIVALKRMVLLDSFIQESQRLHNLATS
jgi:hypothetical protein